MTKIDDKYFSEFNFSKEQINANLKNALRDMGIAKKDEILEVKFTYAYNALLKSGITLLSYKQLRIKSLPGHHIKLIEFLAKELKDDSIIAIGNAMRSKRNKDLYAGGIEITEKECREYLQFVDNVLNKVKKTVKSF